MGGAASLQTHLSGASEEEVRKVFEALPEAERSKVRSAMAQTWTEAYGVCGRFASKDPTETVKLVLADAQIQVKEEVGAPWFTVMGHPKNNEEEKDKLFWVAAFHSKELYHAEHTNRPSNKTFISEFMATCATGNPMVDMAGTYRGTMYYMEKPEAKVAGTMPVVLSTWKAKDAESAGKLLDLLKADGAKWMEDPELLQCILFPTVLLGGDVPDGVPKDDRVVKMVQVFKSDGKKSQSSTVHEDLLEDPKSDHHVLDFEAQHFTK